MARAAYRAVAVQITWWLHEHIVAPAGQWVIDEVVGGVEQGLLAVVRGLFATAARLINGVSALALALLFSRKDHRIQRNTSQRHAAWEEWYSDHSKSGTLNEVMARDCLEPTLPTALASSRAARKPAAGG